MDEKIIIEDRSLITKVIAFILGAVCLTYIIVGCINMTTEASVVEEAYATQIEVLQIMHSSSSTSQIAKLELERDRAICRLCLEAILEILLTTLGLVIMVVCALKFLRVELLVTNKRIRKTSIFGIETSIPLDSITSITKIGILRGVIIGSASGKIVYLLAENATGLNNIIIYLLIARQNGNKISATSEDNA